MQHHDHNTFFDEQKGIGWSRNTVQTSVQTHHNEVLLAIFLLAFVLRKLIRWFPLICLADHQVKVFCSSFCSSACVRYY